MRLPCGESRQEVAPDGEVVPEELVPEELVEESNG